jgi:hypothetical protein
MYTDTYPDKLQNQPYTNTYPGNLQNQKHTMSFFSVPKWGAKYGPPQWGRIAPNLQIRKFSHFTSPVAPGNGFGR